MKHRMVQMIAVLALWVFLAATVCPGATLAESANGAGTENETSTKMETEMNADDAISETAPQLTCLNIGKADCMLLTANGRSYLIDTGYAHTFPALETMLARSGVTHLDGVFLTHCHQDHMGGLTPLSESGIPVDAWYASPLTLEEDMSLHPLAVAAAKAGQTPVWLSAGAVIDAGNGATFTVLGPLSLNTENENNNSLILFFSSRDGSILLCGDMKKEESSALLDAGCFQACDLLKVGFHGDNQGLKRKLAETLRPKAAVILTDSREEPDTPDPKVLRLLEEIGCETYVSQDAHDAWRFTLESGRVTAEDVIWEGIPARFDGAEMVIDVADDTLTIRNSGTETLSLQGCVVYSVNGNETLDMANVSLAPGESRVIGSRSTEGTADEIRNEKRIWNRKKRDVAILYDPWGRPLACADNGIAED